MASTDKGDSADSKPSGVVATFRAKIDGLLALRNSGRARTAARAGAWSIAGYGSSTVLRFISRLVLAKLLTNAAPMGDVATIVVILAGLEMISDLGIGVNIVQHKQGADRKFLGTALSVQALRGTALWAIASALAFPIAWIYHAPELTGLLLFGALSTLLRSFSSTGVWTMTRAAKLRGPTLLTISSEIVGFVVTMAWAIASPSAWAIVGGTVAASATYAAGSYLVGERVWFAWDPKLARGIISFGIWMVISSATYFLSSRGEALMLRGAITDAQFGVFAFATMLVSTPVTAVTQLASQVYFPMLSAAVRDDPARAERQFIRGKWAFTAVALCFAFGGMLIGPLIVALLGLEKSFPGLTWMVQLLALRASFDIYGSPNMNMIFAWGESRYLSALNVIRLIVLVAGLAVTLRYWGLPGAFVALVGAPLAGYPALLRGLNKNMPGVLRIEAATILVLFVGWAIAAAIAFSIWPAPWN